MTLINQSNAHENWSEVLVLWNRIANWIHYRTSETELRQQFKSMLIYLWNEKDWLQEQYPAKAKQIEKAINASKYMGIVGDLRLSKPTITARLPFLGALSGVYITSGSRAISMSKL